MNAVFTLSTHRARVYMCLADVDKRTIVVCVLDTLPSLTIAAAAASGALSTHQLLRTVSQLAEYLMFAGNSSALVLSLRPNEAGIAASGNLVAMPHRDAVLHLHDGRVSRSDLHRALREGPPELSKLLAPELRLQATLGADGSFSDVISPAVAHAFVLGTMLLETLHSLPLGGLPILRALVEGLLMEDTTRRLTLQTALAVLSNPSVLGGASSSIPPPLPPNYRLVLVRALPEGADTEGRIVAIPVWQDTTVAELASKAVYAARGRHWVSCSSSSSSSNAVLDGSSSDSSAWVPLGSVPVESPPSLEVRLVDGTLTSLPAAVSVMRMLQLFHPETFVSIPTVRLPPIPLAVTASVAAAADRALLTSFHGFSPSPVALTALTSDSRAAAVFSDPAAAGTVGSAPADRSASGSSSGGGESASKLLGLPSLLHGFTNLFPTTTTTTSEGNALSRGLLMQRQGPVPTPAAATAVVSAPHRAKLEADASAAAAAPFDPSHDLPVMSRDRLPALSSSPSVTAPVSSNSPPAGRGGSVSDRDYLHVSAPSSSSSSPTAREGLLSLSPRTSLAGTGNGSAIGTASSGGVWPPSSSFTPTSLRGWSMVAAAPAIGVAAAAAAAGAPSGPPRVSYSELTVITSAGHQQLQHASSPPASVHPPSSSAPPGGWDTLQPTSALPSPTSLGGGMGESGSVISMGSGGGGGGNREISSSFSSSLSTITVSPSAVASPARPADVTAHLLQSKGGPGGQARVVIPAVRAPSGSGTPPTTTSISPRSAQGGGARTAAVVVAAAADAGMGVGTTVEGSGRVYKSSGGTLWGMQTVSVTLGGNPASPSLTTSSGGAGASSSSSSSTGGAGAYSSDVAFGVEFALRLRSWGMKVGTAGAVIAAAKPSPSAASLDLPLVPPGAAADALIAIAAAKPFLTPKDPRIIALRESLREMQDRTHTRDMARLGSFASSAFVELAVAATVLLTFGLKDELGASLALQVTGNLAMVDDHRRVFAALHCVEAIRACLGVYDASARVAKDCLVALRHLMYEMDANKKRALHSGAIPTIVWAMGRCMDSGQVQRQACATLSLLAVQSAHAEAAKRTILEAGGVAAVITAMRQHKTDEQLLTQALKAIGTFLSMADVRSAAKECGLAEIVGEINERAASRELLEALKPVQRRLQQQMV